MVVTPDTIACPDCTTPSIVALMVDNVSSNDSFYRSTSTTALERIWEQSQAQW